MKRKGIKRFKITITTITLFNLPIMLQQAYCSINTKFCKMLQKLNQQKIIHVLQHDFHDFPDIFGHDTLSPESIFCSSSVSSFKLRSSRPEVFCKKGVLRNFAKFTGKHLCQGLFLNKVAGVHSFIKKETLAQVFSCEF